MLPSSNNPNTRPIGRPGGNLCQADACAPSSADEAHATILALHRVALPLVGLEVAVGGVGLFRDVAERDGRGRAVAETRLVRPPAYRRRREFQRQSRCERGGPRRPRRRRLRKRTGGRGRGGREKEGRGVAAGES